MKNIFISSNFDVYDFKIILLTFVIEKNIAQTKLERNP